MLHWADQVLLYPTAIGSEPEDPSYNSYPHWARTMLGHAAANLVSGWLYCCNGDPLVHLCTLVLLQAGHHANSKQTWTVELLVR